MTTARDLCQDALEAMQVYAPGETATNPDIARMFATLNKMIDSWSNESLSCYANIEQSATLVPGQYRYTIGTSGSPDINATRPLAISDSYGTVYLVDQNGNRYNLEVVPQARWNLINNVTQVNSNIPNTLFYDPQYPLGIINIYPVPNTPYTLYFDSRLQLTRFSSLSAVMSFPPGYEKAITENLAVDGGMYFPTANLTPSLVRAAAISKGNIKRRNITEVLANYDPEIVSRAGNTYNVYSDSSRGSVQ